MDRKTGDKLAALARDADALMKTWRREESAKTTRRDDANLAAAVAELLKARPLLEEAANSYYLGGEPDDVRLQRQCELVLKLLRAVEQRWAHRQLELVTMQFDAALRALENLLDAADATPRRAADDD